MFPKIRTSNDHINLMATATSKNIPHIIMVCDHISGSKKNVSEKARTSKAVQWTSLDYEENKESIAGAIYTHSMASQLFPLQRM